MKAHNIQYFFRLKLGEKCPTCRRQVTKRLLREKKELLKEKQIEIRKKLVITGFKNRKFDWDKAKELQQGGMHIKDIATNLNVSPEAIYQALRKMKNG